MASIWIDGEPKGKGSPQPFRNGRIGLYQSKGSKKWADHCAERLRTIRGVGCDDQPVAVDLIFHMPRPKTGKRQHPTVRSRLSADIDKLARLILDALETASVVNDDAQITQLTVRKLYALPVGVSVSVRCLDDAVDG